MQVRFYAAAAAATGVEDFAVPTLPATLAELAGLLADAFPDSASPATPRLATLLTRCSFLVNEVVQRDPATPLGRGDVVDVLPPFAGG